MKKLTVTIPTRQKVWGCVYLALQLLVIPTVLATCNLIFAWGLSDAELNFIFFCINFACVAVIFGHFILRNGKIALKAPLQVLLTALGAYYAYTFLSAMIHYAIGAIYPEFYNVNDSFVSTMVTDEFALMFIGTALLVPITEEVLYRGLIFAGLYNRSRILAYAISTVAFAALHVVGYIGLYTPLHLLLCLLEYIPAGLCLAWAYAMSDTIWTPILIHTAVNTMAVLAMR
ncbi:MAG: CPBP family intramembrane metalloprotease [Oscillospiraceae bacterium]|nr:CPBP family intramembrane metalloprotease [Oscillospiraceae bacterium]